MGMDLAEAPLIDQYFIMSLLNALAIPHVCFRFYVHVCNNLDLFQQCAVPTCDVHLPNTTPCNVVVILIAPRTSDCE